MSSRVCVVATSNATTPNNYSGWAYRLRTDHVVHGTYKSRASTFWKLYSNWYARRWNLHHILTAVPKAELLPSLYLLVVGALNTVVSSFHNQSALHRALCIEGSVQPMCRAHTPFLRKRLYKTSSGMEVGVLVGMGLYSSGIVQQKRPGT